MPENRQSPLSRLLRAREGSPLRPWGVWPWFWCLVAAHVGASAFGLWAGGLCAALGLGGIWWARAGGPGWRRWALGVALAAGVVMAGWLRGGDGGVGRGGGDGQWVSGVVDEVEVSEAATRVMLVDAEWEGVGRLKQRRLGVTVPYTEVRPAVGERWRFEVVMQQAREMRNPGHRAPVGAYYFAMALDDPTALGGGVPWAVRAAQALRVELSFDDVGATAMARALVLGDRELVSEALRAALQDTGTAHLLAISGMHLALLGWGTFRVLLWVMIVGGLRFQWGRRVLQGGRPRRWAAIGALVFALFYVGVSGHSSATQRAMWVFGLFALGIVLNRGVDAWHLLSLAFAFLLLAEPERIYEPGFQLSFAAAASIVLLSPHLQRLRERWRHQRWAGFRFWVAALVLGNTVASVVTLPLTMAHFGQLPLHGLWVNLWAVPAMTLVVFPGIVGWVVLNGLSGAVGALLAPVWVWVARAFEAGILWSGGIAGPSAHPSWPWAWAVVVVMALLCFIRGGRRAWLAGGALAAVAAVGIWGARSGDEGLKMVSLDVGHGDALAFEFPEGARVLVDTGGRWAHPHAGDGNRKLAHWTLLPALQALGWASIDLVIVSHAHMDHMGALLPLSERMPVREVWVPACSQLWMGEVMAQLAQRGVRVREVAAGPEVRYAGVTLEFLWPPADSVHEGECRWSINNSSLVMGLRFGGRRILLTGDIEKEAEAALVAEGAALRADILKVPHHGSRTSSTAAFLDRVRPRLAIVSGVPGRRPPPHPVVLEAYRQRRVPLWVTGVGGAIGLVIDRQGEVRIKPP